MKLAPPAPLGPGYELDTFQCGEPALDDWLRRRVLPNQERGATRTRVLADGRLVVGYYALATGGVSVAEAPGRIRRNMPDPIPVMVLGRLAVDRTWQGRGLGLDLLADAVRRTLQAAEIAGIRVLLIHAMHERAAQWYVRAGFRPSPLQPLTLMLLLADARASLPTAPSADPSPPARF